MLKASNTLATWCEEVTHWKGSWCRERLKAWGKGHRGGDGCMASLTRWTWVWARSGSWWWTRKPGMLQSMGLQSRTRLSNWTELIPVIISPAVHESFSAWMPGKLVVSYFSYSNWKVCSRPWSGEIQRMLVFWCVRKPWTLKTHMIKYPTYSVTLPDWLKLSISLYVEWE